jgi:6-phosphogluconolactonase (cycloisomerase 2 family)
LGKHLACIVKKQCKIKSHPLLKFIKYLPERFDCSNRAVGVEGLLTRFDLDPLTGAPEEDPVHLATGGITPRDVNFAGPNADFLLVANQDSNTIVAFRVDPDSGALTKAHSVRCPTPVCLLDLGCPAANAA